MRIFEKLNERFDDLDSKLDTLLKRTEPRRGGSGAGGITNYAGI